MLTNILTDFQALKGGLVTMKLYNRLRSQARNEGQLPTIITGKTSNLHQRRCGM